MTTHNIRSSLHYLDKLADEYNNTYPVFLEGKMPIDTDYSTLRQNLYLLNLRIEWHNYNAQKCFQKTLHQKLTWINICD